MPDYRVLCAWSFSFPLQNHRRESCEKNSTFSARTAEVMSLGRRTNVPTKCFCVFKSRVETQRVFYTRMNEKYTESVTKLTVERLFPPPAVVIISRWKIGSSFPVNFHRWSAPRTLLYLYDCTRAYIYIYTCD